MEKTERERCPGVIPVERSDSAGDPQAQPMLTPTEVMEYLYCPRFTYFLNVLRIPQYEERRYKVLKGRWVHEQRKKHNRHYLRKRIPTVRRELDVYLADPELRVRGIVDEILHLRDGSLVPIDYKFTPYRKVIYRTHKVQLTLYALLIERTYQRVVKRGYLIYIRGGNKVLEIEFSDGSKQQAIKVVKDIFSIIHGERLPGRTPYKTRCMDCTYKNICV
jgi:CRISPR-associated exonuclease Cas4